MHRFNVIIGESDLLVVVSQVDNKEKLRRLVIERLVEIRRELTDHIAQRPEFLSSLVPLSYEGNHPLLRRMYESSTKAGVGPMASVAGITSELTGQHLLEQYPSAELFIENGGDLFLSTKAERQIGIYAGDSPLSGQLNLRIKAGQSPIGICTSAGTIGHSLSFGKADAVVVISKDTALADTVATATGNLVKSPKDLQRALDFAISIQGVLGCLIIIGDQLGAIGDITLS